MTTLVQLYNNAIAKLGGAQLPVALGDGDTVLALCENAFPPLLDTALVYHDWSFARKRAALEKLGDASAGSGFAFRYKLPPDLLRAVELEGWAGINQRPFYLIEGRELLTDCNPATLVYTVRVDTPAHWPPLFAEALAWGLAAALASARLNDTRKQQWCGEMYTVSISRAAADDMSSQTFSHPTSIWETARFGGNG